jgi:hypothetical protein
MTRFISLLLIASFAVFAGSPALADMILSTAGEASAESIPDASAKGEQILAQTAVPAADAEMLAHFQANPDQIQQTGTIGMIGVIALAVLLGSVYFFGATDTAHPGW